MTRIKQLASGATELDQVWGRREKFYAVFMEDYNKSIRRIDPILIELCRLRVAQMVESEFDLGIRYVPALDAGLEEDKIRALSDYPTSPRFTKKERAALEFAEQWVIAFSSIADEDVSRLQEFFTPEECMYFCKALSVIDQFARANSLLRIGSIGKVPSTMPQFVTAVAKAA
jgi:alkylhydroperoxidase family enzyme